MGIPTDLIGVLRSVAPSPYAKAKNPWISPWIPGSLALVKGLRVIDETPLPLSGTSKTNES